MKTETGITPTIAAGHIFIKSDKLIDEPIYNDVTVDTMLRNQLKDQLIKLHSI